MSKFYDWIGFARAIFSVVLIVYQLVKYFHNEKTTGFQKAITWMIQSLTLLQIFYSFYWNYRVFFDCEYWANIATAFIDVNMFLIGILVIYYLYLAVDAIYKFSTTGVLPREESRRNMKCGVIALVVMCFITIAVYVVLERVFYEQMNAEHIKLLNQSFQGFRAFAMTLEAMLLSCTIWKLQKSKVSRTDSGHLSLCDAIVLLVLQSAMIMTGLGNTFMIDELR